MITIMFSCAICGLDRHKLQVPARKVISLELWLETLKTHTSAEHSRVSPHCPAVSCGLYVPAPKDGEQLGQEPGS